MGWASNEDAYSLYAVPGPQWRPRFLGPVYCRQAACHCGIHPSRRVKFYDHPNVYNNALRIPLILKRTYYRSLPKAEGDLERRNQMGSTLQSHQREAIAQDSHRGGSRTSIDSSQSPHADPTLTQEYPCKCIVAPCSNIQTEASLAPSRPQDTDTIEFWYL